MSGKNKAMGFAPVEYATEYHPYADDHQKWQKENFSMRFLQTLEPNGDRPPLCGRDKLMFCFC